MANSRRPRAHSRIAGADCKNPRRYRTRTEPKVSAVGGPPAYLHDEAKAAWRSFMLELPWLSKSDRALLELASTMRARIAAGGVLGMKARVEYRQILSKLGATPSDRSRINVATVSEDGGAATNYLN